jgi:hypothetical protein
MAVSRESAPVACRAFSDERRVDTSTRSWYQSPHARSCAARRAPSAAAALVPGSQGACGDARVLPLPVPLPLLPLPLPLRGRRAVSAW